MSENLPSSAEDVAASDDAAARDHVAASDDVAAGEDAYVVVARRYRPQTFDALVGQQHVARALCGAIETGRVGHAYLFTGARGVGKTSAARIFAKALDCPASVAGRPCNTCDLCVAISTGDDVDVLEIDGASNRGVDEIRQLRQNVGVRPSRARYKIYIIDEVHMLTREAFNALLKTLEEPPEHVKFIFCTTEPEKIPVTILSRCQRFDFAGIQIPSIIERLAQICQSENVTAQPEALEILARRAGGSMRDSQSLLEQILAFSSGEITADEVHNLLGTADGGRLSRLVRSLVERTPAVAIAELDRAVTEGVDVGQLLEQLLGYFRDCMAIAVGCGPETLLNVSSSQQEEVAAVASSLGLETILAIIQVIDHAMTQLRLSTHTRTIAEMALVRVCTLEDLVEIDALVRQINAGLAGSAGTDPRSGAGRPAPATAAAAKKKTPTSGSRGAAKVAARDGDSDSPGHSDDSEADRTPGTPLTSANATEVWESALARLDDMVAAQAGMYHRVEVAGANRLLVQFAKKYAACKDACVRPEPTAKLIAALRAITGEDVAMEFTLAADDPPDGLAGTPPPATPRRAPVRQNAMVQKAVELFDAQTIRVDENND